MEYCSVPLSVLIFFLDYIHDINVTDIVPGTNGSNRGKQTGKTICCYCSVPVPWHLVYLKDKILNKYISFQHCEAVGMANHF